MIYRKDAEGYEKLAGSGILDARGLTMSDGLIRETGESSFAESVVSGNAAAVGKSLVRWMADS